VEKNIEKEMTTNVHLAQGQDKVVWHLEPSDRYSINSLYEKLSQGATVAHAKDMWRAGIPLKIKFFASQLVLDNAFQSADCHAQRSV
jgi:hypothetical protein